MPYYWYDPALGLDVDKIASLRHVDYVEAGYLSGKTFQAVKSAALRHGKQWGGTPNEKGAYSMPAQVAAWKECIKWLEEGRKVKRIVAQP